ncbi:MAG: hypothetical protein R2764_03390 [Bacteroidales bacterium]
METKSSKENYFNEDGHLNEMGVSFYTDALNKGEVDELPPQILKHVEDCFPCKKEIIELSDTVSEIEKNQNDGSNRIKTFNLKEYNKGLRLVAGFAVFIAVAAILYFLFFEAPDYDQLYADNFNPYADVITSRNGENINVDSTLAKVLTHYYNTQNYDSASLFFEILYEKGNRSDVIIFYYANTCLSLKKYDKAIALFDELLNLESNLFEEQSPWYLSLSYLGKAAKADKKERERLIGESEVLLLEIIQSNSSYKSKAQKLLEKY